ncbi:single-stranded DNA-binding protein [Chitinophaga vietnamensis]|uniref:single-stranded DNA-binding protein n=1 Tax=Chitinophaga vietnamensis TaxID=2593957 RepID=UPI0011779109|nr:single-stranded DNA-binding protein [Chitinophaga vietnamensis]
MEIIGRLTADAIIAKVTDNKQVVNFNIAINEYYRPKGSTEIKKTTTYVSCSYWISTKVADLLKKGTLVQLSGRLGVNAYSVAGEARAKITFRVNTVRIHKMKSSQANTPTTDNTTSVTATDDLPF